MQSSAQIFFDLTRQHVRHANLVSCHVWLAQACGPALQLSPMGNERTKAVHAPAPPPQPAAAQAPAAAAPAGADEENPQKIRVIVRKRPMNKKVCAAAWHRVDGPEQGAARALPLLCTSGLLHLCSCWIGTDVQ